MPTDRFALLRDKIEEIIKKSPLDFDLLHARKVLEWVLKLKPSANETLQIAALAHDMERGVTGIAETYGLKDLSNIKQFKKEHAKRSADIIAEVMKKSDYSTEVIARVYFLVENHEAGGLDEDLNILMEADSIAYFDGHVANYFKKNGKTKTTDKVRFMYERMSASAQQIVREMAYDQPEVKEIIIEVTGN